MNTIVTKFEFPELQKFGQKGQFGLTGAITNRFPQTSGLGNFSASGASSRHAHSFGPHADVDRALERTWKLIARGEIASAQGESLVQILIARKTMIETAEFDQRLRCVEKRVATHDGTK